MRYTAGVEKEGILYGPTAPLWYENLIYDILGFNFSLSIYICWTRASVGLETFLNHTQKGSFAVNRSLGTSLTSVPLWHLSCGYMQGIMRNSSLHLLHLSALQKMSCVQKPKGQKYLSFIIMLSHSPLFTVYIILMTSLHIMTSNKYDIIQPPQNPL